MSLLVLRRLDGWWNSDLMAGTFLPGDRMLRVAVVIDCGSYWETLPNKKKRTHGKGFTSDSINHVGNQNNSIKRLKSPLAYETLIQ